LHLAQLSDEDPHLALRYYQSALDLLTAQSKGKERATGSGRDSDSDADMKGTIVRVLISMVEVWMDPSYDLWYGILECEMIGVLPMVRAASIP